MAKDKWEIEGAGLFSATLSLICYQILYSTLQTGSDYGVLSAFVVSFVFSLGIFGFLFLVSVWFYFNMVPKILQSPEAISGDWYYILNVDNEGSSRFGRCRITRNYDQVILEGDSYYLGTDEFRSKWETKISVIRNSQLLFLFQSEGKKRKELTRNGVAMLMIHGKPPNKMIGVWHDQAPIKNHGSMEFFRDEKQFERKKAEILFEQN